MIESIKNNLNNYNNRFLIIISNSKSIKYYIENLLNSENKNYKFVIGSEFDLDKNDSEKKGKYRVDLNFRLIVIINKNQLDKKKSDFQSLNIFERHIFNFRNILNEKRINFPKNYLTI